MKWKKRGKWTSVPEPSVSFLCWPPGSECFAVMPILLHKHRNRSRMLLFICSWKLLEQAVKQDRGSRGSSFLPRMKSVTWPNGKNSTRFTRRRQHLLPEAKLAHRSLCVCNSRGRQRDRRPDRQPQLHGPISLQVGALCLVTGVPLKNDSETIILRFKTTTCCFNSFRISRQPPRETIKTFRAN